MGLFDFMKKKKAAPAKPAAPRATGPLLVYMDIEKLGGGGHITIAGAQLDDVSIEEATDMLKNAIDEVLNQ